MRRLFALCLVAGCSEYTIEAPSFGVATPNPRELESPVIEDRLVQTPTPAADVLFVVDNSSSMMDEQAALAAAFPSFIDWFVGSGLDYHIGVVSTDMDDEDHKGKLIDGDGHLWIDTETFNPEFVFTVMSQVGITGSGDESGRAAAYWALEMRHDEFNAGFRRDGASLHVIVISDEDDKTTDEQISKDEFIDWMLVQQTPNRDTTFNAIVNAPGCCGLISIEQSGDEYIDVSLAVGGILHDIRTEEWDTVLDELGLQAAGYSREFFLSELPVPETIEVEVVEDGVTLPLLREVDWIYAPERNSVQFLEYLPAPFAEINISYTQLAAAEL